MPLTMIHTLIAQNTKKAIHLPIPSAGHPLKRASIMALRAEPPIQVWMPNQPQATPARRRAGMLDPSVPKLARTSTGKGMPNFVPGTAFRIIGISTMTFPSITVKTACQALMPPATRPAASMYVGMHTLMPIQRAAIL